MVEKDTGTAEHVVCLAVLLDDPIAVELGNSIGTVRVERRGLGLWNFFYLAVQLGSRSLINLAGFLQMVGAHRFENTENTYSVHICRELRGIKGDLHMGLCSEVVYLIRLYFSHQFYQRHRIAHIGIMQVKMRFTFEMRYTLAIVHRTATDDTVYLVSLLQ